MNTNCLFLFVSFIFHGESDVQDNRHQPATLQHEMCWWYDKPATKYWEGMPVGTGRFAAMIGGEISHEEIPFNDETVWSGGPYNPNNPEGPSILASARKYVLRKDYVRASEEASRLASIPVHVQHYQPMGVWHLAFDYVQESNVKNYRRKLSMDSALVSITYTCNGVEYTREVFATYPDQVLVMRITANKPGKISLATWLTSLQPSAVSRSDDGNIIMNGTTLDISGEGYEGHVLPAKIKWQSQLKVIADQGQFSYEKRDGKTGALIRIKNANAVTLILAAATNWKSWNDVSANEQERCWSYIKLAGMQGFAQLKKRHLDDYLPLFSSCKIDLGTNEASGLTTSERMARIKQGKEDHLFISQYFQYGRYLLLAAARENTLAFNNHNIWLDNIQGRWQGRWTLNINLQECYWPVESTHLQKLNESLLLFTEMLAQAGTRTARELYGCRGWTAHHGTDIWFNTAPTDGNPMWAIWPMGGAWLLQQLFDHYTYAPDPQYLRRIYPLLKGSCEFFLDFLISDPATGWLVTCPSTSPENTFYTDDGKPAAVSMGSSMDNQILRNLFRNYLQAAALLNTDKLFADSVRQVLGKLPPHRIGKYGQIQEWLDDFKETEPGHRHLSPLFAAYPDDDISLRKTPELAEAIKTVLHRRGDINRGWSGAWKINLHARLEEAEPAYDILKKMLTEVSIHPSEEDSKITPSFEGNQGIQGVTAGIAGMLMQSHSGEISLLPALPVKWPNGGITGLRAKGGYDVDISWKDHHLLSARLRSGSDTICKLRTKTSVAIMENGKPLSAARPEENLYVFKVSAGRIYQVVTK